MMVDRRLDDLEVHRHPVRPAGVTVLQDGAISGHGRYRRLDFRDAFLLTDRSDEIDIEIEAPTARAFHDANQSIANNTLTGLAFNSERFDNDVIHDPSVNNSRLTCKTSGKYVIGCSVNFDADPDGFRLLKVRLNGTTDIALVTANAVTTAGIGTAIAVETEYDLAVNDYVEVLVQHTAGAALNILVSANYSPEFWMTRTGK